MYPVIYAGSRVTAGLLISMLPLIAVKGADQTRNNDGTLGDDSELRLPLAQDGQYLLDLLVRFSTGGPPDIKTAFTVPSGTTMTWAPRGAAPGVTGVFGDINFESRTEADAAVFGDGGGGPVYARLAGRVLAGATAGLLQFQWCQNVATVSDTKVLAGSWMKLRRTA